ncbi:MAG TPA: S-methyl-5-thioribose-1-phosphate isomerase [Spirochaetota bacterium]
MSKSYYTIKWQGDCVSVLDQRLLPFEEVYRSYTDYRGVAGAISDMVLRGAPLIGIAAAFGIALGAKKSHAKNDGEFKNEMNEVCVALAKTRPTAVNLSWAVDRMKKIIDAGTSKDDIFSRLEKEALMMFDEDIEINKMIGKNGSRFLSDGDTVLTHCNAGALATAGYGTALGVVRAAIQDGKKISVMCSETRPYLQGARLTAWELMRDGIDVTLICDNMSGHFMKNGTIQKVIVGADRIAANGDTANKIGTYMHSVCAKEHHIPFYIAAPVSTLDVNTAKGNDIIIEERPVAEVAFIRDVQIAQEGIKIYNPSFDVTPAENISAIITEKGIAENLKERGISHLVS